MKSSLSILWCCCCAYFFFHQTKAEEEINSTSFFIEEIFEQYSADGTFLTAEEFETIYNLVVPVEEEEHDEHEEEESHMDHDVHDDHDEHSDEEEEHSNILHAEDVLALFNLSQVTQADFLLLCPSLIQPLVDIHSLASSPSSLSAHDDHDEDSTLVMKILYAIAIFFASAIGSFPFFIQQIKANSRYLDVAMAFASGVFIAAGLIHIIPEAMVLFQNHLVLEYYDDHGDLVTLNYSEDRTEYPIIPAMVILGFMLVFTTEKVLGLHSHTEHNHQASHPHCSPPEAEEAKEPKESIELTESATHATPTTEPASETHELYEHANKEVVKLKAKASSNPWVMLLAIGLHAVFEGISMGLLHSPAEVTAIFVAIIAHKAPEGIGFAASLAEDKTISKVRALKMLVVLCMLSPIGIAVGIIITEGGATEEWVSALFIGLTGGMFIYVGCVEGLEHAFHHSRDQGWKLMFMLLGIVLMCVLRIFTAHDHTDHVPLDEDSMSSTTGHEGHDH